LYFFDNNDNNIKIKISDVTDNIISDITDIEVPNIEVPNIDDNLIEINSIINDIDMPPIDIKLRLVKQENVSGLNKINELFDSFE
jgi:hypothetical protein